MAEEEVKKIEEDEDKLPHREAVEEKKKPKEIEDSFESRLKSGVHEEGPLSEKDKEGFKMFLD